MNSHDNFYPEIVPHSEFIHQHDIFLEKEKKFTKQYDKLNAQRRRLPIEYFDAPYSFEGPQGKAGLLELFEGRRQLLLYNFMFEPGADACVGCSMVADNLPLLTHLHVRDTTLALISPAPYTEIASYRKRMGWNAPWYSSSGTNFNEESGVGKDHRMTVFLRDGDQIYRCYYTNNRGIELLGTIWALLDITPFGRQEEWEDSPAGRPQTAAFSWWRKHDEYTEQEKKGNSN